MNKFFIFYMLFLIVGSSSHQGISQAPVAPIHPYKAIMHGDTRIDNYHWMRLSDEQKNATIPDAQTQDVLEYLESENDFQAEQMMHTEDLQEALIKEIVDRIKQDDSSLPYSRNGYLYYTRYEEGEDYQLYCRKEKGKGGKEEILLNGPEMANRQSYFAIANWKVSKNNKLLAYSVDLVSRRQYTIHIKNLKTGITYKDQIEKTTGRIIWANDNKTIFYTKTDPVTLRSNQIYKHVLGSPVSEDELVFEEKDETYRCSVSKSKSGDFLMIDSRSTLSTEYRYLDANNPNGEWAILQARERNLEYSAQHFGDHFYILTNLDAKNFRLVKTPVNKTDKSNWEEVIGHRPNVIMEELDVFKDHLIVTEREDGLSRLRVIRWDDHSEHYITFRDPAYSVFTTQNFDFETDQLRFGYTSLTTPYSLYDYDLNTRERVLRKQIEVLGEEFSPDNYISERILIPVRDGVKVPVSIVYRKGFKRNGKAPTLLYGYGSYGASYDPYFSTSRLSLLDRGFVFGIVHVRGGQEMGRSWYEDGKLLKKKNTFYDFIDCTKYLIDNEYTSREHLYAQGGSAGGLLMGAVVNMEPDLWNGVIAQVPFVDVINTMLDESIPLTTSEFDEWGNPKEEEFYHYMKSYSPYDNIEAKDYPNLLITTGFWDSQVQYWEPAKWAAKLRALKTNDKLLLLKCNLETGHGGASGRMSRYEEVAYQYAFLLNLEGIKE